MTEVCAFVIVLGLIPDIVGFVSATPVKLLPSTAGKVAGKTSSTNLPEPFNCGMLFADVPTFKSAAVPSSNCVFKLVALFKLKAPKVKISKTSLAVAPLANVKTVSLVFVKSVPSTNCTPFKNTKTGLEDV